MKLCLAPLALFATLSALGCTHATAPPVASPPPSSSSYCGHKTEVHVGELEMHLPPGTLDPLLRQVADMPPGVHSTEVLLQLKDTTFIQRDVCR